MENKNITWSAQEFKAHDKTALWYIAYAIISLALVGYAIYTQNLLTLIAFALLSVVTFFLAHQKPRQVVYELTATAVVMGQISHPYRNIKKFWIIYTPDNKSVNFETTAYLNNQLNLPLGKQDPLAIKQFLKSYLPEDLDKEESLTDILARKIRF